LPKIVKAKDLAKLYRQLRMFKGHDTTVEYTKGGRVRLLTEIQLDTVNGRATTKSVSVREDGRQKHYDGNYEFEVTALLAGGRRFPTRERE
jgi:hypothetical protein